MSTAPLHGTWEMIRAESGGEPAIDLLALRVELELTADVYVVRFAGEIADRGTCSHAPAPAPSTSAPNPQLAHGALALTLTGTAGPNLGRTIPCIYQLAGDRLRICYGMDGTAPTAFASPAGSTHYLATYRRKS